MEYIDIDNRDKNPSYDDIFEAFRIIGHNLDQKYYWSNGDEVTDSNKVSYLGELMSYIEDEELLNGAIDYFKNMNFVVDIGLDSEEEINMNLLCYADSDFDKLINKFPKDYFSNIELIKIKAIVYSLFVRYDILITDYSFINLNWERFPILITLNDRIIEHNFYNVIDSIDRNGMIKYINDIKKSPINEQIASIHNAISVCIDINHKNNSNAQSNSIEYLEKTLKNLISMSKSAATEPQPPTPSQKNQSKVKESPFSVLEWATIFYYADSCKYFNQKNKAENQSFFIDKHSITTSKKSFKNKVIEANKSINNIQNYSIEKLNKILPFVKENYRNGVAKIENDKEYLKINDKNDTDY